MNAFDSKVTAIPVPVTQHDAFLPSLFGMHTLMFKRRVNSQLCALCRDYTGGYWNIYGLSNGGCYLVPYAHNDFHIVVPAYHFEGTVKAEGAGIVATLFALDSLARQFSHSAIYPARVHQLRSYASMHPDTAPIMAAVN